jgi:FkbM family methyltransferase
MSAALTTIARDYVRFFPGTLGKARIVDDYLNPALRSDPVVRATTLGNGVRMVLDTKDIVQRYLYQFGVWEPALTAWLTRVLRPGDVFVDVGANIGYFSLLAARIVGHTGSVVAIECSPTAYGELCGNLARNQIGNVRPVARAVAETACTLAFYEPKRGIHSVTTSVRGSDDLTPAFRADAAPLPDLLSAAELGAARVIKIDVEGGEYAALSGLAPALDAARDDVEIVVEVNEAMLARQSRTIAETTALLTDRGFHPYRLVNSYRPSASLTPPSPPRRVREPITGQADLVFSRVDAATL